MNKNKKVKLDQGDSKFIKFFFDLFYRTNQSITREDDKILPYNETIDVLICGAGSCVHELPVLLKLFESSKYKKINLTFVDKAVEPFMLLHFILQEYGETKNIGKEKIKEYFYNVEKHKTKPYSICNSKIEYSFQVMDLELDPHETNGTGRYQDFTDFFDGKDYDIVIMSMFLQHISYWRSLIAFLNKHLKEGGYFWFNELGKDDYLLTLDLYMAIIDNKRKKGKWKDFESSIINYYECNRDKDQMLFSIISDNDEISPTNTEICRDFFDFFGSEGKIIFEESFQSDIKPSDLFEKAKEKFSPFTKLHSFIEDETLSPIFSENNSDEKLDFTMTWYAYPKVKDKKIYHFNVLDMAAPHMDIPALQQYINRTLDILNLNTTIFKPTFLRSVDTSEKMVEWAIDLFRRFQLFKIEDFQSIVFFIPDIDNLTVKCFNDTTKNYKDDFKSQKEFQDNIVKYNETIKDTGESNSTLFFDKYKTMMTKPFSIILEPLERPNNICEANLCETQIEFKIDEYGHSPNQKVHIIKVAGCQTNSPSETTFVTPLRISYNHSSLTTLYKAFNEHFNGYRSILIPCFREPLLDKNKEFLGDLIIFQAKDDNSDNTSSIEFFSWLIRKFIDFTQIATYLDYKRIILQSLKSAIAAIMSRNMSHNLGSHFVSNTKNDFGRRINYDRLFDEKRVKQKDLDAFRMDYRGNVRLLQYIQERMDFIATIVSADHYALGPLNFKAEFFDILTNDDCGERHGKPERNFMLQYLLYSEKYTRTGSDKNDGFGNVRLVVNYNGKTYTGLVNKEDEKDLKIDLSKLRLAVPGGVMSRHALLTIVENILRNSAKHNKHVNELVLTIEIKKEEDGKWELSFYDNCNSAKEKVERIDGTEIEVYQSIEDKLKHVTIINDEGSLDKHDKGLKEMLICALWLQNKDVAETLLKIQQGVDNTDYIEVGEKNGNLCYTIKLENFEDYRLIDKQPSVEELLGIHADFVISGADYEVGEGEHKKKLSEIFPRFVQETTWCAAAKKIKKELEDYALVVETEKGEAELPKGVLLRDDQSSIRSNKKCICFYDHLTNAGKEDDFNEAKKDEKIVYLDSISGENFTSTLVTPLFLKEPAQRYKVIQSALAKIAIVDERIWNDYRSRCTTSTDVDNTNKKYKVVLEELNANNELKDIMNNIREIDAAYAVQLFNILHELPDKNLKIKKLKHLLQERIDTKSFIPDITCQLLETKHIYVYTIEDGKLIGLDGNEVTKHPTFNFVTVHLGLIEKLSEASGGFEKFLADKVIGKEYGNNKPFVAIHSGRGNFSPELEESLRNYPFLSLSAVESALNNSKYLLSELLYNTNYYGKGNINHKQED